VRAWVRARQSDALSCANDCALPSAGDLVAKARLINF